MNYRGYNLVDKLYDKTFKIAFSAYGDDFLRYFGEYKNIIEELGTEFDTLYGEQGRLDKLVLVEDDTLQNWEFEFKKIDDVTLKRFWKYNNVKSAQWGKILDSFIISFANPQDCDEMVKIGESIYFTPIIKYLQNMELHKKLNVIEKKVNINKKLSSMDELTLIFVTLTVPDKKKETVLNRVCDVLNKIDYIKIYKRKVIDSLIAFQIENFVKFEKDKNRLNEVVSMQVPVERLIIQAELEAQFDEGFEHGFDEGKLEGKLEGKDEIILNMLKNSFDMKTIQKVVDCTKKDILRVKNKNWVSK